MFRRILVLGYGIACYLAFLASFLYLLAFLANAPVPRSIDSGPHSPWPIALAVDLGLVLLFGLQHSVMARPGFKAVWTRIVPKSVERPTYVLATVVVLAALFAFWRPLPHPILELHGAAAAAANTLFGLGVLLVLVSTFAIDHFELFGLRQAVEAFRGKPPSRPRFFVSPLHRFVRHPLYVGWILTFFATPHLSVGRLVLALAMLAYILVAIGFEERDLATEHGAEYERFRARTPMLLPRLRPVRAEGAGNPALLREHGSDSTAELS